MMIQNGDHLQYEIDNAGVSPEQRSDWPLPSFDAQDWAKAFCKIAKEKGHDVDEDWMITWFANALMRGFDEGRSRAAMHSVRFDGPDFGACRCGGKIIMVNIREVKNPHNDALRAVCLKCDIVTASPPRSEP